MMNVLNCVVESIFHVIEDDFGVPRDITYEIEEAHSSKQRIRLLH